MNEGTKNIRVLGVHYLSLEMDRFTRIFTSADQESYVYDIVFLNDLSNIKRLVTEEHPDIVIIDNQFKAAAELCQFIRSQDGQRHTGIIFTTMQSYNKNEHSLNSSVQCLDYGADDFIRFDVMDREFYARVKAVLKLKLMGDELRKMNHQLEHLSLTDDLTGLANMRQFYKNYAIISDRVRSAKSNAGVIVFDVDHFKSINDRFNHIVGSSVLTQIGKYLTTFQSVHHNMMIARFGGDEFIVVVEQTSADEVQKIAEDIRAGIEALVVECQGAQINLTASFGSSFVESGHTGGDEKLIKTADQVLFVSKEAGRNCVTHVDIADINEAQLSRRQGALVYNTNITPD